MFFEKWGKLWFTHLHPLFVYLLILMPLITTGFFIHIKWQEFEIENRQFAKAVRMKKKALSQMKKQQSFLNQYQYSDPYFIDHVLEPISFLQKEESQITAFLHHPACSDKKLFEERLAFIQSEKNKLRFAETNLRFNEVIKETEEKQRYPIQMDGEDIQKICALIENIPIGQYHPLPKMPQLVILQFDMKLLGTEISSQVYEVDMKLLQREWIN